MKKSTSSTHRSAVNGSFVVHGLRTGKIRATQASASEIRRSVGVRPAEAKVAAEALRLVVRTSEPKTTKVASKPTRTSPSSSGAAKNR